MLALGMQARAAESLSLEDSVRIALERNPGIMAQNQEVSIKDMDKRSQFSRMLPTVDMSYGYMQLNEAPSMSLPAPIGSVPMGTEDNYELTVEARQVLFAGGALYNSYLVSKNDLYSAELDREKSVRELKLRVIDIYHGVIKARQIRELAMSSLTGIKAHLDVANAFFNQGMIPKNDLLEAEVRYAQREQDHIMAINVVKLAESAFNILLGRPHAQEVLIDAEIPIFGSDISLDESLQTALDTRQEIKIVRLQLDSTDKGITIARSEFMPSVAATYTYDRIGEDPDVEDDSWQAGIGLTWNLFQGGGSYWRYNRAKYTSSKVGYLLDGLKDQVTIEVKTAYLSIQDSKARMDVASKAIAQAEENMRIQKDRFNLQVATTTDVLDAQTLLDQARKNYIDARADLARANASLKAAMGTL